MVKSRIILKKNIMKKIKPEKTIKSMRGKTSTIVHVRNTWQSVVPHLQDHRKITVIWYCIVSPESDEIIPTTFAKNDKTVDVSVPGKTPYIFEDGTLPSKDNISTSLGLTVNHAYGIEKILSRVYSNLFNIPKGFCPNCGEKLRDYVFQKQRLK